MDQMYQDIKNELIAVISNGFIGEQVVRNFVRIDTPIGGIQVTHNFADAVGGEPHQRDLRLSVMSESGADFYLGNVIGKGFLSNHLEFVPEFAEAIAEDCINMIRITHESRRES